MAGDIGFGGFLGRWLFAAALVFGTYNPSDYSYVSWLNAPGTEFGPVPVIVGIALLILWIFFLRATFMAIGRMGIFLGGALCAAIIWLMVDIGWLNLDQPHVMVWLVLGVLSLLLGVGMSWSHFRLRMTGQFDVDDVDD